MARNNHIINSFVNGEVTPKFAGRTNLQQYNESCEKLFNTINESQGGAGKRCGTALRYQVVDKDDTVPDRAVCLPFFGADGTKWQIIMISEDPKIPSPYTPGTTQLNWVAINMGDMSVQGIEGLFAIYPGTSGWWFDDYYEDFVDTPHGIQYAQSGDILYVTNGVHRPLQFIYDPSDTPKFSVKSYPQFESGRGTEIWRQMPFEDPIVQDNTQCLTLAISNLSGLNFSTSTIAPGPGSTLQFDTSWHGRFIKFTRGNHASVFMVWDVDSASSAKVVPVDGDVTLASITDDYGTSGTAANFYEIGYWDEAKGWPRSVTFFESRILFGGTTDYPDTIWASMIDNVDRLDTQKLIQDTDYGDPVADSDPFSQTLKAELLAKIQWMSPGKTIVTGTEMREFVVKGPDPTETIGPANKASQAETEQGSARAMAVRVENATLFLLRDRRRVGELTFNFAEDSFKSDDVTILAEHMGRKFRAMFDVTGGQIITRPYFLQMVKTDDIIWVLNNSGALCALRRNRAQQVTGWSYHELAGTGPEENSVEYPPAVRFISPMPLGVEDPDLDGQPDTLCMIVERTLDGNRALCLEQMLPQWDQEVIWAASGPGAWDVDPEVSHIPLYLDCAIFSDAATQRQAPISNAPGVVDVPYGDGEEVSVIVDGEYLGEFTVANDEVDFSAAIPDKLHAVQSNDTWQVIVGFNYTGIIIPTTPSVPAITGSSLAQPQRVHEQDVHFYNTLGAQVGLAEEPEEENSPLYAPEELTFEPGENQNEPFRLFTGIKPVTMPGGNNRKPRLLIQSDKPFPMHVTHVVAKMVVSE